ncbi:VIR protein [Plasmodium vivax]|uniref:VIR protein n=1 Tax=Plasmodium vivax TaxID=5855 RepID=A0A1G4HDM5_PLAVI|nr:VIR protein [Plasmodium vivax]
MSEIKNVWEIYEDFEKNVSDDVNSSIFYDPTCTVILKPKKDYYPKYKEFCMKLVKNLGAHSTDPKKNRPNTARCKHLYYWLYYLIMKHKIPDDIIKEIFQKSKDIVDADGNENMCSYNKYSEFLDKPEEMLKINLCDDNIIKIKGILMENEHRDNCSCRKYIYDCVRMYKEMNSKYCSTSEKKNKYNITCTQLGLFKYSYDLYYKSNQDLKDIIPSLDKPSSDHYFICPSSKLDKELSAVKDEQGGSSTLPTAIGTMAGVSSVLAFLYKFTPAGNLLHSGLRGNIGSIKNTMYSDDANPLTFDRLEHSDYNSYNIGYEAT